MVRKELCTILASDYYYPAMILAAFRLVAEGGVDAALRGTRVAPRRM